MLDILVESPRHFPRSRHFLLHRLLADTGLPHEILGPGRWTPRNRLAVVHVNLTTVPDAWLARAGAYPAAINSEVGSIDRRQYTRARLARGDDWAGRVIVKTVLNHRGRPEFMYRLRRSPIGPFRRLWLRARHRDFSNRLFPPYRVFPSLAAVPDRVWSDSALIVEKYLGGVGAPPVVKFRWDFLLDVSLVTRSVFETLECDPNRVTEVTELADVPPEVRALRERLAVEFGSIDYFETDEGVFPIDVNKTTTVDDEWIAAYPFVARYVRDACQQLAEFARTGSLG